MKTEVSIDGDNWVHITLEAETAQEAAQLVMLGMNKSESDDSSVYIGENAVRLYTSVKPVPSRLFVGKQTKRVSFQR